MLTCAGVNSADSYEQLCNFVRVVSEQSPVRHFIVHCRKALLNYSPADNRKVPPLRRGWAYALARDFPHLTFSLNGQVRLIARWVSLYWGARHKGMYCPLGRPLAGLES